MEQYETEEQQVEAIKRFWKENGCSASDWCVIGLGWTFRVALWYNDSQIAAKEQASFAYEKASEEL